MGTEEVHGSDDGIHIGHFTFEDVIFTMIFLSAIWAAGKLCERISMPGLIGEIIVGSVLGPKLANFVPEPLAFMMIGEIGLILLVVEAGLEIDLAVARQSGTRGVLIGIVGTMLPLLIGFGIALMFGMEAKSALAVGACFGPTSMGVALVVLKKGNVLNSPIGQVIVAAAVVDDVLALVILSELKALIHPAPIEFIAPILSALGFSALIGYIAVIVVPRVLPRVITYIPPKHVDDALLGIMLSTVIGLMCALHFGRGSYLFGAFLGGLCFCTEKNMMHTWHNQVKRIMRWLLRIFFSCTVGFQVPLQTFWSPTVLGKGFAFFLAVFGKVAVGSFVQPLALDAFLIVGASMATWGEFAFIIAVEAKALELIGEEDYAAVIFAVLLSILVSPYALTLIIKHASLTQEHAIDAAIEDEKKNPGHVYYKLYVRVHNVWGLQSDLLALLTTTDLHPIEFRVEVMSDGFCMYEAYLKDNSLQDDCPDMENTRGVVERMSYLRHQIADHLTSRDHEVHDYGADVEKFDDMVGFAFVRWMPGDTEEERVQGSLDVEKAKKMMAESGFKPRSSANIFKDAALQATTSAVKGYSGHRDDSGQRSGFEGVRHSRGQALSADQNDLHSSLSRGGAENNGADAVSCDAEEGIICLYSSGGCATVPVSTVSTSTSAVKLIAKTSSGSV